MRGVVVHLATNINAQGHSLFWTKVFAEKIFKSTGAVYQSCVFFDLANGSGEVENRYRQSTLIGDEVVYLKVYNTVFKKVRTMIQDFNQGFSEDLLFEQPNMAKVLAYQPFGLPNACKKNHVLRKIAKDYELQIPLKVLDHRLEVMESLDHLHSARVEFVCSLMNTSIRECQRKYTGDAINPIIDHLSKTKYDNIQPLVALPRDEISTYLRGLLSCLLTPIRQAFQHFFVEKRPVSPDVLETVHVCECLVSFIIYGTKNYFPKLANIGLTIPRYKEVNRVTLAYTAMKTRTEVFRIDASANTAGTVYSIALPLIRNRTQEDAFTKDLLLIHSQLKLNKFNVAEVLLTHIMEIIAGKEFSYLNPDPIIIFSKPFVLSLPFHKIYRKRITVSEVVDLLLTVHHSDTMRNSIETAIETLGDLEDDHWMDDVRPIATTALRSALNVIIYLALKRKIRMDITYVPVFTQGLSFRQVVPDLSTILEDGNPPVFDPYLTQIVLSNACALLGKLNPFPDGMGIPTASVMFLLYTLLLANVNDVPKALSMLGVAIVLQGEHHDHTALRRYIANSNLTFQEIIEAGLCRRLVGNTIVGITNTTFRHIFVSFLNVEEKSFIRAHNNLHGSGLHRLQMV